MSSRGSLRREERGRGRCEYRRMVNIASLEGGGKGPEGMTTSLQELGQLRILSDPRTLKLYLCVV